MRNRAVCGEEVLDLFHSRDEIPEQFPVVALPAQVRPEVIALPAADCVVAEQIVSYGQPYQTGVEKERHFLEVSRELSLFFKRNLEQISGH